MRVGISLLTCNHLKWTRECVRTLKKYTPENIYDVCCVDNGSTDQTVEFLTREHIYTIEQPENIGVPKARNLLFKLFLSRGIYDYVCIIHNDMLFTPFWLEKLIELSKSWPRKNLMGGTSIVGEDVIKYTDEQREKFAEQVKNDKTLPGNFEPKLFSMEALNEIGLYDEVYGQQECEDVDHNFRAHMKGYDVLGTNQVVIYHAYALTRFFVPEAHKYIGKNQKVFREKFPGVDIEAYNHFRRIEHSIDGNLITFNCV